MVEGVVLAEVRGFLKSRIILSAAELDIFTRLARQPATVDELLEECKCDKRGLTRLLDCLVTFELLYKENGKYRTSEKGNILSADHPETELPMVLHLKGMWQSWSGLTETVRLGKNPRRKSIRERDQESLAAFIGAMHVVGRRLSREIAESYDLTPGCRRGYWNIHHRFLAKES
ncbi:MAG: hypothetical protein JRI89_08205 [Deltaproteobacteria bacterium]|nr:hypothetical protein [Deltaproteobacteria bacterium]